MDKEKNLYRITDEINFFFPENLLNVLFAATAKQAMIAPDWAQKEENTRGG